jgi:hypothetical protein
MQQQTVSIALNGKAQGAMVLAHPSRATAASSNGSSNAVALSKPKKVTAAVDADARRFDSYMLNAFAR